MPSSLTTRAPRPSASELVASLVPPPRFESVSFDTYIPDPAYPSQARAVDEARAFIERHGSRPKSGGFRGLFRASTPQPARGIYMDGGFGVGKTHLLTSVFHEAPGRTVYGTFVEYTNLVGVLGYPTALDEFSNASILCIDEFELDDVGDTLLMTRLIRELSDRGVAVAATSNTLPGALGEGRFAAQDFLREISAMADRFDIIRIDGEDYRHRDAIEEPPSACATDVEAAAKGTTDAVTLDSFESLLSHLITVHPSRYGAMIDGIERVHVTGVRQLSDHNQALRLVVFIDRLYDRAVPIVYSGVTVAELFSPDLLASGYAKKYYRCISRLGSLAADGASALSAPHSDGGAGS